MLFRSQTTSADIWWKAKKAIADGMIGQMIESQGSYHRNGTEGEWNWDIDAGAGPEGKGDDNIDWSMWLGSQFKLAPKRAWMPTASSASASTGIIPWVSPATSSIT